MSFWRTVTAVVVGSFAFKGLILALAYLGKYLPH